MIQRLILSTKMVAWATKFRFWRPKFKSGGQCDHQRNWGWPPVIITFSLNTTIFAFVFLKVYRSPLHAFFNKSSDPIYCTGSRYLVHSISLA
jgi:hypothetical protein